jgi:putative transcriptional regulator
MGGTEIDNAIRVLRAAAGGLSQQELADAVGVARQTINAIEGRKYSPTLELAFKISRTLGKPLEEVFIYPKEIP